MGFVPTVLTLGNTMPPMRHQLLISRSLVRPQPGSPINPHKMGISDNNPWGCTRWPVSMPVWCPEMAAHGLARAGGTGIASALEIASGGVPCPIAPGGQDPPRFRISGSKIRVGQPAGPEPDPRSGAPLTGPDLRDL